MSNLAWTVLLTCCLHVGSAARLPTSCEEIHENFPDAPDGDYWMNISQYVINLNYTEFVTASIFCFKMSTKPQAMITLLQGDNFAHTDSSYPYPPYIHPDRGTTHYSKVAVKFPLEVYGTDDFSSTDYNRVEYGHAYDCRKEHWEGTVTEWDAFGLFGVDLTGTGFIVSPLTEWQPTGWQGGLKITMAADRTTVSGRCGGWGGGCKPFPKFYLQAPVNLMPPGDTATEVLIEEGEYWMRADDGHFRPSTTMGVKGSYTIGKAKSRVHCSVLCAWNHCAKVEYNQETGSCKF